MATVFDICEAGGRVEHSPLISPACMIFPTSTWGSIQCRAVPIMGAFAGSVRPQSCRHVPCSKGEQLLISCSLGPLDPNTSHGFPCQPVRGFPGAAHGIPEAPRVMPDPTHLTGPAAAWVRVPYTHTHTTHLWPPSPCLAAMGSTGWGRTGLAESLQAQSAHFDDFQEALHCSGGVGGGGVLHRKKSAHGMYVLASWLLA